MFIKINKNKLKTIFLKIQKKLLQNNILTDKIKHARMLSSVGRAFLSHGRGHKFDPCSVHHK